MTPHRYGSIPGNDVDIQPLYSEWVRDAVRGATFVELGVFCGRSLAFLAVEALNADKALRVIGVDLWEGARDILARASHPYEPCSRATAEKHLEGLGVQLYELDTAEAAEIIRAADYVFVDGDHSYEGVKRDIEAWAPRCHKEIAGHDHFKEYPGVEKAAKEAFGADYKTQGIVWRKSL